VTLPPDPPAGPPSDPARVYRDTIGRFATGVTVVTAIGPGGPAGMTTNAVTSLSLDPRLLLVCFERRSRTLDVVRAARRFAVNILRAGDEELAAVFASKAVGPQKFAAVTGHRPQSGQSDEPYGMVGGPRCGWSEEHGVPVLDGALAWIACDLLELRPGGDHEIGIGRVLGTGAGEPGEPLVFFGGRYTTIAG
jgi:flavin reductase (DIM6/NTAB) family NADH-FMN oxidoreductase RutF